MELDRFLRAIIQRWYLLVLPAVIGLLSAYLYLELHGTTTAQASVAVVEPAVTRAVTSQQAQVTFSAVAESYRVAERVIARLGLDMEPREIKESVSVKLSRSLVANVAAPLYIVTVEHRDPALAMTLADTVVDEAKQVFFELNAVDPANIDAAFRAQEEQLRAEVEAAREALQEMEDANEAWMLPSLLNARMTIFTGLQQTTYSSATTRASSAALRAEVQRSLSAAQAEQARLRALQPEYDRLAFDFTLASSAVSGETSRLRDLSLSGDPSIQGAVQNQLNAARTQMDAARNALTSFQQRNRIGDLPADLSAQSSLIADLRRQLIALSTDEGGMQKAIEAERQELQRLSALLPQHEELTSRISRAQAQLNLLMNRKLDLMISGVVAPAAQVKLLDTARVEPQVFWTLMISVLGTLLGFFAGLVMAYLVAYFDRTPRTSSDVEDLFGLPVLARLPKAKMRG